MMRTSDVLNDFIGRSWDNNPRDDCLMDLVSAGGLDQGPKQDSDFVTHLCCNKKQFVKNLSAAREGRFLYDSVCKYRPLLDVVLVSARGTRVYKPFWSEEPLTPVHV